MHTSRVGLLCIKATNRIVYINKRERIRIDSLLYRHDVQVATHIYKLYYTTTAVHAAEHKY